MCYMTVMSTNSELDLQEFNTADLIFKREMPGVLEEMYLMYPHKWYIESQYGCSCGFRHLMACNFSDLGFADPVEWFDKEPEDIEATLKLVRIFKKITMTNNKLDCIDAWAGNNENEPNLSGDIVVNLKTVSETAFRLIENYRHEIVYET
jgi:hypothetical protein